MLRIVVYAFALFLLAAPASAQENTASFAGTVSDPEGLGLGGVQVKVFVDGYLKGSAVSGADGSYDTTFVYDPLADVTIVAWFVPQVPFVPEIVVLRESAASKSMGLWSPCLPRIDLNSVITHNATIYDEKAKFAALGQQDCF